MGDSIFNGAIDNASGTAALIQMAHAFVDLKPTLKRSMLFLAVGGEEKGLLGSKYYAANPSIEPNMVSMNVNIDGLNVYGLTEDVIYVGLGRSTIDTYLLKRAKEFNRTVLPDQNPELGYYYRSDHFSFAKIGIPAIYLGEGEQFVNKPDDYLDKVNALNRERYHTVFDEMDSNWELEGAIADLKLLFYTVLDVTNASKRMEWNKGDEFEQARLQK